MESYEMTISIPQELQKRIEELQEELDMQPSEIVKEALKYYIDLMDIDDALESDPFKDELDEAEDKDPYDLESYDLPPLLDEGDFSDYPDYA
jgi:predicted transcriptional regulator